MAAQVQPMGVAPEGAAMAQPVEQPKVEEATPVAPTEAQNQEPAQPEGAGDKE